VRCAALRSMTARALASDRDRLFTTSRRSSFGTSWSWSRTAFNSRLNSDAVDSIRSLASLMAASYPQPGALHLAGTPLRPSGAPPRERRRRAPRRGRLGPASQARVSVDLDRHRLGLDRRAQLRVIVVRELHLDLVGAVLELQRLACVGVRGEVVVL